MEEKIRINLWMSRDTVSRLDEFANKYDISRTAAISFLCKQGLDNADLINELPKVLDVIQATNIANRLKNSD